MEKMEMIKQDVNLQKRFESKIEKSAGCWLWKGTINPNGYGQIKTKPCNGKTFSLVASRYALYLKTGVLPAFNIHACHTCDNRQCVNPEHLFWGTSLHNQIDCMEKGRRKKPYANYDEARKIRAELRATKNYAEIAEVSAKYGLSEHSGRAIKYGTKWDYIPESGVPCVSV